MSYVTNNGALQMTDLDNLATDVDVTASTLSPAEAMVEYNTKLAKLMQGLKKSAGASMTRQNYRGTGSKLAVRQIWVRFNSGAVLDVWLEKGQVRLGGIVSNGGKGPMAKMVFPHANKTPEQIYADVAAVLNVWANGATELDRTLGAGGA